MTTNYNYIGGNESNGAGRRDLHELNATYKFSDKYSAAKINSFYSLSPRYEYFNDPDGFAIAGGLAAPAKIKVRMP